MASRRCSSGGDLRRVALLLALGSALPGPAARADEGRVAEARRHFDAGNRQYAQGRFAEALVEFQAANRLKPDAALLYDLAQTHRALGHQRESLRYYRAYLDASPYAPNRDEVKAKITALGSEIDQLAKQREAIAGAAARAAADRREAEEAKREAEELTARARELMSEAQMAREEAREAQARLEKILAATEPVPIHKRWWLWTGVGAVTAGGVIAAVLLTRPTPPSTAQGNIDFDF